MKLATEHVAEFNFEKHTYKKETDFKLFTDQKYIYIKLILSAKIQ